MTKYLSCVIFILLYTWIVYIGGIVSENHERYMSCLAHKEYEDCQHLKRSVLATWISNDKGE